MGIKVVNGDKLWNKVQRADAARRRRDRQALAEGKITPQQLRDRNFWFPGPVEFLNIREATRALVRCRRRKKAGR